MTRTDDELEQLLRASYARHTNDAPTRAGFQPITTPPPHRPGRRVVLAISTAAIALAVAVAVTLLVVIGPFAHRGSPAGPAASSTPPGIASGISGPLRLDIVSVTTGPVVKGSANDDETCVHISYQLTNITEQPYELYKTSVVGLNLQDEYGPITETDNTTGITRHLAAQYNFGCPAPNGNHGRKPIPPARTLDPGQTYGPLQQDFAVTGDPHQSLALLWSSDITTSSIPIPNR
jgi:hypothetical protein